VLSSFTLKDHPRNHTAQCHHKEMRKGVLCKIAPPPSPKVPRPYFNLEPELPVWKRKLLRLLLPPVKLLPKRVS